MSKKPKQDKITKVILDIIEFGLNEDLHEDCPLWHHLGGKPATVMSSTRPNTLILSTGSRGARYQITVTKLSRQS